MARPDNNPVPYAADPGIQARSGVMARIRDRRARLRALRSEIAEHETGSLPIVRDDLLQSLPIPRWVRKPEPERFPHGSEPVHSDSPDARVTKYVANVLALDGIVCRPSLRDHAQKGPFELRLNYCAAAQGAIAVAVGATLVGLYAYWAYGLVLGLAGAAAVWLARNCLPELDRWSPAFLPRGRLLGATLALILAGIAAVTIVWPMHVNREADLDRARAQSLSQQAIAAAEAGDVAGAAVLVGQAVESDASAPGIEPARLRIMQAVVAAAALEPARPASTK